MDPKEEVVMKIVPLDFIRTSMRRVVFVGIGLLLVWSCGSSRQTVNTGDESLDIDELVGEKNQEKSKDSDEAEVLKLLGITSEDTSAGAIQASATNKPPVVDDLESDVDQLKQELLQKDREIYELHSELTKKEMKISELETQSENAASVQSQQSAQPAVSNADYKTKYQYALDEFRARKYKEAIALFRNLIASNPKHELADNCQYWIGESYYGMGNYNQAIAEFEKVFSYPNSNKNDDAQLKLGISYVKLGDRTQARSEFDRLLSIYPDSEYRSLAQKYIARL